MQKLLLLLLAIGCSAFAEVQPETMGVIRTLPETYPPHWIIVQDSTFFHMSDGKFIVIDADSDDSAARFKGFLNASFIAQFHQARTKPELYVAETFHSRGNRGVRTDVLTIFDKSTLTPKGEVVVPAKRVSGMPTDFHLQLVDDERIALIYNFTPATSVSVVDIEAREFLGEIPIPGCALVYPMAGRAFASLCSDGSMLSVQIDDDGGQGSSHRTEPFFDADSDPLMEKATIIDGVGYFPTFLGNVYPVDLSGSKPDIGRPWSLVGEEEGDWRPGGLQLTGRDADGRLYVLMHPQGYDGSHKDPGVEVWIFDTKKKRRVQRIELATPAISVAVTRDEDALLVATNINLEIDVYSVLSGEHLRTIGDFGQETPFMLHGAQ